MTNRVTHVGESDYVSALNAVFQTLQPHAVDGRRVNAKLPLGLNTSFASIADVINPTDRSTSEFFNDPESVRKAMIMGAGVALHTVELAYKPDTMTVRDVFSNAVGVFSSNGGDDDETKHFAGAAWVDLGERGVNLLGELGREKLGDIADIVIPDIKIQRIFTVGAGVVFQAAYTTFAERLAERESRAVKDLEVMLTKSNGYDWDAALRGL